MRSSSTKNPQLVECTNPSKNIWVVRWDVKQRTDENERIVYEYEEQRFEHIPSENEVREAINAYCNKITDQKILEGFRWNDTPVWLSSENQFNYKATYDLAVQTGGKTLPVTFKLGTDEVPSYVTFNTVEELGAFYTAALAYIQECYTDGWGIKDTFDYSDYIAIIQDPLNLPE